MDKTRDLTLSVALDALRLVRSALDIPHGATTGDQATRDRILVERATDAKLMLTAILGDDPHPDPRWLVAYYRDRLAEHPAAGYRTQDRLDAGTR